MILVITLDPILPGPKILKNPREAAAGGRKPGTWWQQPATTKKTGVAISSDIRIYGLFFKLCAHFGYMLYYGT